MDGSSFTAFCSLFYFNFYCHWSLLVLRNRYGMSNIFHIREGVTQGDQLATVAYGTGVLPPIKLLKAVYIDVTQPWYDYYAGALGTFNNMELHFN